MSTSNEEPPAKRQKRSLLGASDRITVDVGGTKFITSVSTLISNSVYFESLLSDNWEESNNGDDEVFIDQDPEPFRVLLAYMREGFIKIGDINERVLAQAEFLGVERLLQLSRYVGITTLVGDLYSLRLTKLQLHLIKNMGE